MRLMLNILKLCYISHGRPKLLKQNAIRVFLEIDITNKSLYGKKKSSVVAFCMSGGDVRRGPAAWCWAGRGT